MDMFTVGKERGIDQITSFFYRLGLWQRERETVIRKMGSKLFYLFFSCALIVTMGYGAVLSNDLSEKIFLTSIAIAGIVHLLKIIYILWKKEEIFEFIYSLCVHSVEDYVRFIEIQKTLRKFTIFTSIFLCMLFTGYSSLFILTLPIFWNEKRLAVAIWFPLDWKNNDIAFWMANGTLYIFASITFFGTLLSIIVWYLMLNCSIKYDTLGFHFRNLGQAKQMRVKGKKTAHISKAKKQQIFLKDFVGLIEIHQNLHSTIKRFNSCFSPLFFTQVTTSGLSICCIIYGLVFSNHENLLINGTMLMSGILYCIFDIHMVMHLGNKIKMSSDCLSYCLYESEWIDLSEESKKHIIILTEILKFPQELVVGKLYPLNLNTFTGVLNIAYRSFHILQNL